MGTSPLEFLKIQLLNQLTNEKALLEQDLNIIVNNQILVLSEKLSLIRFKLKEISVINVEVALVNQYFQEVSTPNQQQQATIIHQGQSHGE
jgi:hypothetical protein